MSVASQTCAVCGKPFEVDADLLAKRKAGVEAGLDPAFLPPVPTTCPACTAQPVPSGGSADPSEDAAIAAALLIGQEMQSDDRAYYQWLAKRVGLLVAGLGLLGFVMLFGLGMINPGERNLIPWMLVMAVILVAGSALAYWGFTGDRSRPG